MKPRFPFLAAGIFGATGVALGAFGAHKLEPFLVERGTLHAWETAVHYQLVHAVALLAMAIWTRLAPDRTARCALWAARCWSVGITLFSGSLYLLALGGTHWLGPITPLGGAGLIAGWVCVAVSAFANNE